jgi:hypothetical protein
MSSTTSEPGSSVRKLPEIACRRNCRIVPPALSGPPHRSAVRRPPEWPRTAPPPKDPPRPRPWGGDQRRSLHGAANASIEGAPVAFGDQLECGADGRLLALGEVEAVGAHVLAQEHVAVGLERGGYPVADLLQVAHVMERPVEPDRVVAPARQDQAFDVPKLIMEAGDAGACGLAPRHLDRAGPNVEAVATAEGLEESQVPLEGACSTVEAGQALDRDPPAQEALQAAVDPVNRLTAGGKGLEALLDLGHGQPVDQGREGLGPPVVSGPVLGDCLAPANRVARPRCPPSRTACIPAG